MMIDALTITVLAYLLALLVVGLTLGLRKVKRYNFLITLQAVLLLLSFMVAQNLGSGPIPSLNFLGSVEAAMLFVTAAMLVALVFLRQRRGEQITARFATALLGAVLAYLLIKLASVIGVYPTLPDYAMPLVYLGLLLAATIMIYLRAKKTRFL